MKFPVTTRALVRLFGPGHAFSLAETTMAVAIAALGIVSIMGLMPQGLETSRKTGNIAAQSRIMQEVTGDLESMDWASLDNYVLANPTRTYDDQGVRLNSGTGAQGLVSYVAHVDLKNDAILPQTGVLSRSIFMRRLVVKIANTGRTDFDFSDSNAIRYKTIAFLIPKIQ